MKTFLLVTLCLGYVLIWFPLCAFVWAGSRFFAWLDEKISFVALVAFMFASGSALAGIQPFSKPTPAVYPVHLTAILDTNAALPFDGINFYYSTPTSTNPLYICTMPATNGMASVDCSATVNQFWSEQRFYYAAATNSGNGFEGDYFTLTNPAPHFVLRMK